MPIIEFPLPDPLTVFCRARYDLVDVSDDTSPVHLTAAVPIGYGTDPSAPDFLPDAARPERGRMPSGRGLSAEDSRISAVGEAVQLVSTCWWGDEETVPAAAWDLDESVILPNDILTISDRQFVGRSEWNENNYDDWLPEPFEPGFRVDWMKLASVAANGGEAWVPAACVLIGWFEAGDDGAFYVADSNGTAAGPTLDQAIESAFLELVERDATALWWHGQHRRPRVDLNGHLPELLKWMAYRDRFFQVLDLTTDFAIPVFAAVSAKRDGSAVALGVSANFDPEKAMTAALTELIQMEANYTMVEAHPQLAKGAAFGRWMKEVSLSTMPCLQPAEGGAGVLRSQENIPPWMDSRKHIADLCSDRGLKAWFADLTRPGIGVPVARVIVPGLRSAKSRFGPGRLYDVPPAIGWCAEPIAESQLNPVSLAI